jgi:hypothetical protein
MSYTPMVDKRDQLTPIKHDATYTKGVDNQSNQTGAKNNLQSTDDKLNKRASNDCVDEGADNAPNTNLNPTTGDGVRTEERVTRSG